MVVATGALTVELATRRSTKHLARAIASVLVPGDLVVLIGPLGSGKTFFTRALLRELGLSSEEPVTSPTFALVNEHQTEKLEVWHADLYRLGDSSELDPLGMTEARSRGAVLVVEWGEPYIRDLGGRAITIRFQVEAQKRSAVVHADSAEVVARIDEKLRQLAARRVR